MKLKRRKHCEKYLAFYRNYFRIHRPYQLLVDLTFCQEALQNRVQIKDQLARYLDGEFKLFITDCIKAEGHMIGSRLHGALVIADNFSRFNCGHDKAIEATSCISSLVKNDNQHGLFIATQDHELRDVLRSMPGIPLLHVNHNVIVLEKPSTTSIEVSEKQDSIRLIREHEQGIISKIKTEKSETQRKKRKGPKGPNPLSVKKKQKLVKQKIEKALPKQGRLVEVKKRRAASKNCIESNESFVFKMYQSVYSCNSSV